MEDELFEFKAPSGDIYKCRRLRYREKKAVMRSASQFITEAEPSSKSGTKSATKMKQILDVYKMQEEAAWRCIVEAPWLPKGKKCTLEMLDNIKPQDASALDTFIDGLNFPRGDVEEKSAGQSEVSKSSPTQK